MQSRAYTSQISLQTTLVGLQILSETNMPAVTWDRHPAASQQACVSRPLQVSWLNTPDEHPVITAGSKLLLHVSPRDRYNNTTENTQAVFGRVIGGPTLRQLNPEEARQHLQAAVQLDAAAAGNPHGLVLAAEVQQAGSFVVDVTLGGEQVANRWLKALVVQAGQPSAAHCRLGALCQVRALLRYGCQTWMQGFKSVWHQMTRKPSSGCLKKTVKETAV